MVGAPGIPSVRLGPARGFCLITARSGSASGSGEIAEIFLTATAGIVLWVTHHLNRSLAYWHHRS
jgi:hypothetical protein